MRTSLILALLLTSPLALAGEQQRTVEPFNAIDVKGPIDMVVQVGQAQSIQLKGDDKYLTNVQLRVVNGKLMISYPKEHEQRRKGDLKMLISMPSLKAFHVEGAGSAELNNIQGDSVDLGFQGAGRLIANGKVSQLKLVAQGVGDVNTKSLQARNANVNFEGIGAVKVYASERLDAKVQGMGSLNYYGNPRIINKQVEGIGTVKAGG